MNALSQTYLEWRRQPVPEGSTTWDELDELHAAIYVADYRVADDVIPYVEKGVYSPNEAVDVAASLVELHDRALELQSQAKSKDKPLLDEHLRYIGLMRAVYDVFLSEGGDHRSRST
jgi:hypothetical protein